MRLDSLTRPELIFVPFRATDGSGLLRDLAERLVAEGIGKDAGRLHAKLLEREELGTTAIGNGFAIPHCKLKGLDRPVLAIAMLPEPGIPFEAEDGRPVRGFFLIVSPHDTPADHLKALASLSRWLRDGGHRRAFLQAEDSAAVLALLATEPATARDDR